MGDPWGSGSDFYFLQPSVLLFRSGWGRPEAIAQRGLEISHDFV